MTTSVPNIESKIKTLEAELASIECQTSHQGFRDASRRNRIVEEVQFLRDSMRSEGSD